MSQLSHLIQQAKNSRRINDMFKTESLTFGIQADTSAEPFDGLSDELSDEFSDELQARLSQLETLLFDDPMPLDLVSPDIIRELELVAGSL